MQRALLSVSDKTGIEELARFLVARNVDIISTGGTAKFLEQRDIRVIPVEEVTGNPEAFGGRMKTLSFQIGSAILHRRHVQADVDDLREQGILPIDLVVCNFYPFEEVAESDADLETLVEHIDIGGPSMVRSAAKNYRDVAVLTNPAQYSSFMDQLSTGSFDTRSRLTLALAAIGTSAYYDSHIYNTLNRRNQTDSPPLPLMNMKELRYGENPHQRAWLAPWKNSNAPHHLADAQILQGKALSYNNMHDADAAWKCCSELHNAFGGKPAGEQSGVEQLAGERAVVCIVKHGNPCGVAVSVGGGTAGIDGAAGASGTAGIAGTAGTANNLHALEQAWACDPVSSFGSIIAFNREVGAEEASWLGDKFVEILIAPSFSDSAQVLLSRKKNMRILCCAAKPASASEMRITSINGAILIQNEDELQNYEWETVTQATFPPAMHEVRLFGVLVNKYLKSNSMALVGLSHGCMVLAGAGMGQPNRLDSLKMLAAPRAAARGMDKVLLISDAFLPFRDNVDAAGEQGIGFIVQPGGSIRDAEVIQACNERGIAMCFTRIRHFRH